MLFSGSPAVDWTDLCVLFSHPPSCQCIYLFSGIAVWFITLIIIHKWANQNYDCIFFVVQRFVFLRLIIVFCLLRLALLSKLSQNWKIFSRCAQAHPIFCQFYWLTCVLGTSLYHLSGNFLPLSLCLHPTYSSFGAYSLGRCSRRVTEHGLWNPPAWVQILTDEWISNLGKLFTLSVPEFLIWRMGGHLKGWF